MFALLAAFAAAPALASRVHRAPTSGRAHSAHRAAKAASHAGTTTRTAASRSTQSHARLHGQQAIESSRVTEIQQALIREHYLDGEASGRWDSSTEAAMQKYQADQGWQTKLMPDSRALKKLGLGPDYSGAINAHSSSFTPPPPPSTIPSSQAAGFAAASGINH